MSDFSDRPFVAGSLFGLRAFAVDKLGRLTGPSYREVFRPGDNEAVCKKRMRSDDDLSSMILSIYYDPFLGLARGPHMVKVPKPQASRGFLRSEPKLDDLTLASYTTERCSGKPETCPMCADDKRKHEEFLASHTVGEKGCTCGFYAYFDGRNDYLDQGTVAAVIEGFGICTVGDRGFRAGKARLVALIAPKKERITDTLWDRVQHNYPNVPTFGSRREALAAFPLTMPDVPTPETRDDFWDIPA